MAGPSKQEAPAQLPGLDPAAAAAVAAIIATPPADTEKPEDFDWFRDECVIIERQTSIAVYRNERQHVVIRSEGDGFEEDRFIIFSTEEALQALITSLQRELRGWKELRK